MSPIQQIWDLLEASFYFLLGSGFQFFSQNNVWHLEASQVQLGRSHLVMPSCMSKYGLGLGSKIISADWKRLMADPGGQFFGGQPLFFLWKLKSTLNQTLIKACMKAYWSVTCLSVSCCTPGPTSSGLQMPSIIFGLRNDMLTLKNLSLDMHKGIPNCDLPICTWLAFRSSLQVPDIILT